MADKICFPTIDYGGETTTPACYAASGVTDLEITALFDALVGITIGSVTKSVLKTETDKDTGVATKPANGFAQREIKWLVRYVDTVNQEKGHMEVGTADASKLTTGTDFADLAQTEVAAFVTALEAAAVSRDGNAISVSSIELVGRNT